MKGLTASVIATRDINVSDGVSFSVRGLSGSDILNLYKGHAGELAGWFDKLQVSQIGQAEIGAMSVDLISDLTGTLPEIAAEIIAFGSGAANSETIDIASRLPLSVQIEALQGIADLTFTETMPPKKVIEIVINAAKVAATQASVKP